MPTLLQNENAAINGELDFWELELKPVSKSASKPATEPKPPDIIYPKKDYWAKKVTEKYTRHTIAVKYRWRTKNGKILADKTRGQIWWVYEYPEKLVLIKFWWSLIDKTFSSNSNVYVIKAKNGGIQSYIRRNAIGWRNHNYGRPIHGFLGSEISKSTFNRFKSIFCSWARRNGFKPSRAALKFKGEKYQDWNKAKREYIPKTRWNNLNCFDHQILCWKFPLLKDFKGKTIDSSVAAVFKGQTRFKDLLKKAFGNSGRQITNRVLENPGHFLDIFRVGIAFKGLVSNNKLIKFLGTTYNFGVFCKPKELRRFLKNYNEDRILSFLNDNSYILRDTVDMYNKWHKQIRFPVHLKKLEEIHDYYAKEGAKIKEKLVEFKYNKKTLKLDNLAAGEFTLKLPQHSHQLIEWGQILKNCAANYVSKVSGGYSIIIGAFKQDILTYLLLLVDGQIVQFYGERNCDPKAADVLTIGRAMEGTGLYKHLGYANSQKYYEKEGGEYRLVEEKQKTLPVEILEDEPF